MLIIQFPYMKMYHMHFYSMTTNNPSKISEIEKKNFLVLFLMILPGNQFMLGCLFSVAIQSVFDKIECPRESIEDLLGANQGIKENNMMQYLGIVEERTNELLRIKSYIDFKVRAFLSVSHPLVFLSSSDFVWEFDQRGLMNFCPSRWIDWDYESVHIKNDLDPGCHINFSIVHRAICMLKK